MDNIKTKNFDFEKIKKLLKNNDLPYDDIHSSGVEFITSEFKGKLVGCIGIEKYGEDGLLRSLAVEEEYKNRGLGKRLLNELIKKGKNEGIKKLHLLTTTAYKYFTRNGFRTINRLNAPVSIAKSKEFSELCPSNSIYMVKEIK